jgi:ABC-type transport system substrate-binding protein
MTLAQAAFAQDTTGTTGATGSTNDDQKVVFTWAGTGEPDSVNPMTGYSAIEFYFWTASYHLPIDFNADFGPEKPSPEFDGFNSGLVTDVQVSDDSTQFTYTIRDDLFWSDGEPLTAADVAYTLNLYKNNHAYLPASYVAPIDGDVRTLDDTTIQFDTAEPTGLYNGESPFLYTYILPQHVGADRAGATARTARTRARRSPTATSRRSAAGLRHGGVQGRRVRPHGAQPVLARTQAGRRRDHLPDLQDRRRDRHGAADRRSISATSRRPTSSTR